MIDFVGRPARPEVPIELVLGSFAIGRSDGLHALLQAARSGDPAAMAAVLGRVRRSASSMQAEVGSGVVIPVPGHLPGLSGRLVVPVAEEIAAGRGWRHVGDALSRRCEAPEAKAGGRRDVRAEAATLEWRAPQGAVIVLVDDVVRTGSTIRACAEAIRATGDERRVVAIALAAAVDLDGRGHSGRWQVSDGSRSADHLQADR